MARRTKREMEHMTNFVTLDLLANKNDPHKAFEAMVKEHLEAGQQIPYYINGIKDYIKVSQELAVKFNQKEQMRKRDQERHDEQQMIKDYILNLTQSEMKEIYKTYKDNVSHSDKLNLIDIYTSISMNELKESYINQSVINTFTKIYKESILIK